MNLLKEAQIALLSGLAKYKPDTKIILWEGNEIENFGEGKYSVVYANGIKCWYINGQLHREDGPAVVYASGDKEWYLNDIKYTEEDWASEIKKTNEPT